jgi:CheY-like chemotaxis protein
MKILIADDETVSRRMLHRLLTKWGYEVVSAEDGKSAWELLNAPEAPRIALLDWMMPERNGVASAPTLYLHSAAHREGRQGECR